MAQPCRVRIIHLMWLLFFICNNADFLSVRKLDAPYPPFSPTWQEPTVSADKEVTVQPGEEA